MKSLLSLLFIASSVTLAALAPIPEEQTREVLMTCQNSGKDKNSCLLRDAVGNMDEFGRMSIVEVEVDRQLSKTKCTRTNYSYDREKIVTRVGCGAVFRVKYSILIGNGAVHRSALSVRCESKGGEPRECRLDDLLPVGIAYTKITGASLQADLSNDGCAEPKTWSWDPTRLRVEVGCRGIFNLEYEVYGRRPVFVETQPPPG